MLAFGLFLNSYADGPARGIVYGKVECGGKVIPYFNVFIEGTTIGTTTDSEGNYQLINIPEGRQNIKVQGIGYKPMGQEVIINSGSRNEVNFIVEEDVFLMEQVVVTSDRNEISRSEAPVIVNLISPKTFEQKQSNTLIDGLDYVCGVRTECNCQNCGFSQVRMNGLEGPYSQILINSRPVFSGLAGVYGLEILPANMIQRVEIVRGGGSALFGGNAIAGTINVITKEPVNNTFQVGANLSSIGIGNHEGGELSQDKSLKFNGSLVTDDNKAGLFMYGFTRNQDPYDENNDGFTEMVKMKNNSIGFSTYFKPGTLSKINLDFYKIVETRRGGNKLEMLPHETDITEMVDHDITGVGLSYDVFTKNGDQISLFGAGQNILRNSYYGAQQDPTAYGTTHDLTYNLGVQSTTKFDNLVFLPATLIVGGDFTNGSLKDEKLGVQGESNTLIANQQSMTGGIFIQNEWASERAKFSLGLRFDSYRVSDHTHEGEEPVTGNVVNPRVTFLYDLVKDLQFRASYAKGYRAPQIFDEDLHIETSGARRITHSNDPSLKLETSHSLSSSFNYHKVVKNILIELLAEGFYTRLLDPFANVYSPADSAGNVEYVRVNATDGAYVAGLNTELSIANMKNLTVQVGFTLQKSEYDTPQAWGEMEENTTQSFLRTPNQYGYLTFGTPVFKNFIFSVTGTYTGPMKVPHFGGVVTAQDDLDELLANGNNDDYENAVAMNEAIQNGDIIEGEELITSKSFFDIGFKIRYQIPVTREYGIQLNAGMENILNSLQYDHDRGVYRDAGFIYGPCQPRTVFVGIVIGSLQ
jgi:outer membrane receptor for ferrienterochelin and colicins